LEEEKNAVFRGERVCRVPAGGRRCCHHRAAAAAVVLDVGDNDEDDETTEVQRSDRVADIHRAMDPATSIGNSS